MYAGGLAAVKVLRWGTFAGMRDECTTRLSAKEAQLLAFRQRAVVKHLV